jgi:hypothetical protein
MRPNRNLRIDQRWMRRICRVRDGGLSRWARPGKKIGRIAAGMHFDWSAIQEITRSGPISFEQLLRERSATSAGAGLLLHFTDVRASVNDRFAPARSSPSPRIARERIAGMVPVQASAEPQSMPQRPYRAAPSRRSRTQGHEAAAVPLPHRECASPRSARWQEAG